MSHVYGPIFSRRLGWSLGIDPLYPKTCNLNCVYCQLGPTPGGQHENREHPPLPIILGQVRVALRKADRVDHLTISGSGEPTLYEEIGPLIRGIKAMARIPVAVITNGTRLTAPAVREALCLADVVLPSLDAAEHRVFNRITRPPGGLDVEDLIAGLVAFRRQFRGQLWLEIMLVRGLNDSTEQLDRLRAAIDAIQPDRVHLNTVVRPPAAAWVRPVSPDRMAEIAAYLGPRCEAIPEFPGSNGVRSRLRAAPSGSFGQTTPDPFPADILEAVKRRPMTMYELADALGVSPAQVAPCVARLMVAGGVRSRLHQGRLYYTATRVETQEVECNP